MFCKEEEKRRFQFNMQAYKYCAKFDWPRLILERVLYLDKSSEH